MNKKLTSLLAFTFLFSIFILTSCASHPGTKIAYFKNGQKVGCHKNDCKINQDILYCNVFSQTGTPPPNYASSPSDTSSKVTSHSGTITDQSSGSMYSFSGTSRRQTNWNKKGMEDMSNALGNLARMVRHERQVENRFYECMNIMMGYDLVRKSNQPIKGNVPKNENDCPDGAIAYFKNGQFDGCYKQSTYPDGRPFVPDPEGTSWDRSGNCTVSGGASCICTFTTKVC